MVAIPWYIPFNGGGDVSSPNTIDWYNNEAYGHNQNDVVFPLISYGAFQKSPSGGSETDDDELKTYTSKFDLDKYNRWYVESFYPSLSMLETMKKAFEWKKYAVGGNAFTDNILKDVFMSTNLADGQVPIYNLGNPKFGQVSLSSTLNTSGKTYYSQELNYPYFKVFGNVETEASYLESKTEYNFESVFMYDLLGSGSSVTVDAPSYMYQPNEKVIVVPASGFYKVEMRVNSTLNTTGSLTVMHHIYDPFERTMSDESISLPVGFTENTPIEIALVRNYNDNYELIKGKRNKNYETGNPNQDSYTIDGRTYSNVNDWLTCFPHEDPYNSTLPTKQNDLTLYNTQGRRRNDGSVSSHVGSRRSGAVTRAGTVSGHEPYDHSGGGDTTVHGDGFDSDSGRRWTPAKLGYIYNDGEIMCYDQAVSDAVICGFSSFYGGVASVMKNGYSWSKSNAEENQAFYPEIGYSFMRRDENNNIITEDTDYHYNTYINTPVSYVNSQNTSMNGFISCMVWLEKDDILELMEVHRGFTTTAGTNVTYNTTTNVEFKIT